MVLLIVPFSTSAMSPASARWRKRHLLDGDTALS